MYVNPHELADALANKCSLRLTTEHRYGGKYEPNSPLRYNPQQLLLVIFLPSDLLDV